MIRRRSFLALPLLLGAAAQAQGGREPPAIGLLLPGAPLDRTLPLFREGLRQNGLEDGRNVRVLIREAKGDDPAQVASLARELADAGSRLVVTGGTTAVEATRRALPDMPIVLMGSADPVALGFARSLAKPGGRVTGISIMGPELFGKHIQLLREALPNARRLAALLNRANPGNGLFRERLEHYAQGDGATIAVHEVGPRESSPGPSPRLSRHGPKACS